MASIAYLEEIEMLKGSKLLTAAVAAVAALAVAAPAASANWTDGGVPLVAGENPSISLGGTITFSSPNGGIHCNNGTAVMQLTGGTTKGHLTSFGSSNPSQCEVSGGLVFLTGGTTSAAQTKLTFTPELDWTKNAVDVTFITYCIVFNNGFKLTLSGDIVATPNNSKSISSVTLSGSLSSAIGTVTAGGSLAVQAPNSGTFGLE